MSPIPQSLISERLLLWEQAAQEKYDRQMEAAMNQNQGPYHLSWETVSLTEDEKQIVLFCRSFAKNFRGARISGSNLFLTINKLAELLDASTSPSNAEKVEEPLAEEEPENKWHFGYTGPVLPLRKPLSPNRDS
jgi:hypothetical protein